MLTLSSRSLNFYYPTTFVCFTFITFALFGISFSPNMSDHYPYGIPDWLSDAFGDPIWEEHQGPWRRRSHPASPLHGGSRAENSSLQDTNSEPGREPPEWCIPWSVIHEKSPAVTAETSDSDYSDGSAIDFGALMDLLADPYWAERGWVLVLIIEFRATDLLTSLYRRRSESLKSRLLKQTPADSHRHSTRPTSSNN